MDYAHFQLRHGNQRLPETERICNFVFADGHAEGLKGSQLPKKGDNFYLPQNLTSTQIWAIKLSAANGH